MADSLRKEVAMPLSLVSDYLLIGLRDDITEVFNDTGRLMQDKFEHGS